MSEVNLGDYNRGGYIAFMFSMAVTILFFIYISFIHPGVDLKEMEVQAAQKEAAVGGATPEAPADAEQPKDAAASEQGVDAKDPAPATGTDAQKKEATGDSSKAAPQAEPKKAQ